MPKADSYDTTTPSGDGGDAKKAIAASQSSLLNDPAGANEPAVNRSKKMTRRNAMTSTAATLALTLKSAGGAPRRRMSFPPKHDAEFNALLDEYEAARKDLFAEQDHLEVAQERLPKEFWLVRNFSPSIVLIPGRGRVPDMTATSYDDIDAFMETVNASPEGRADPQSNMNVWARERRAELDAVRQRYERYCKSAGVAAVKDAYLQAVRREATALEAIAVAQPRTVEGCLAQAAFLSTYLEQSEIDDCEFAKRLCGNLTRALARFAGTAIPKVPSYLFV